MNPLDSIHSDEQFFGATKSVAGQCQCAECAAARVGDRLSRAELIAKVAYEMSVEVSTKPTPPPTGPARLSLWERMLARRKRAR